MLLCERRQLEDEKLLLSTQVESGCEDSLGISCPRACVSAVQCFLHGVCQRRAKREGTPRAHRRTWRPSLVTHTHTDSLTHPPSHTHLLLTHSRVRRTDHAKRRIMRRGIRKRARDRAMGPDLGLSASTHRFVYLYPGLVGLSLNRSTRLATLGTRARLAPVG